MKTTFFKRAACAALAVGLVMVSCTSDKVPDDDGKNNNGGEYQKGYLAFSIISNMVGGPAGRAYGDLDAGEPEERLVNKAIIVLYDASGTVAYQFPLNGTGDYVAGEYDNNNKYTSKAQEVDIKPYKLAVFINPHDDLVTATAKTKSVSELEKSVTTTAEALSYRTSTSKYDNFLMGNFAGLVEVETANIYPNAAAAEAAPVDINVERAVAKVVLKSTLTNTATMSFSGLKWGVDVINKSTVWMRKQTDMIDPTQPAPTTAAAPLLPEATVALAQSTKNLAATQANRVRMYAADTNFSQVSQAYWDAQETAPPYARPGDPALTHTYATTANIDKNENDFVYVLENTMREEEQWEDVTTSALIKVVITPAGSTFTPAVSPGTAYYIYTDLLNVAWVFTGGELQTIAAADAAVDQITIDGNQFTWNEYLAENPELANLKGLLEDAGTKTTILGAGNTDYSAVTPAASVQTANGSLKFFADGANYYNEPIRHFSNTYQPVNMKYGRYGVVRNNVYYLTLESIRNYGDITIPEKDKPDDTESWLSVRFEILPWMDRSQGINL